MTQCSDWASQSWHEKQRVSLMLWPANCVKFEAFNCVCSQNKPVKVSSAALSIIKSLQGNTSYSMQVEYNTKIVMKDKTSGKVFKASSCNKLPIVVILEKNQVWGKRLRKDLLIKLSSLCRITVLPHVLSVYILNVALLKPTVLEKLF